MDAEEQKLFQEFKLAIEATQLVSFEKYIKPFLESSHKKQEELIIKNNRNIMILVAIILLLVGYILYLLTK